MKAERTRVLAAIAIVAVALCACLAIPSADAATEHTGDEFLALDTDEDGVITLTEDVTVTSKILIEEGETYTIDLDGYTLTSTYTRASDENYGYIENAGTLTILDGTITESVAANYIGIANDSTGTMTLTNVTVTSAVPYAIVSEGTATITGCTVSTSGDGTCIYNSGNMTVTDTEMIGLSSSTGGFSGESSTSSSVLTDCVFSTSVADENNEDWHGTAVATMLGATVTVNDCVIEDYQYGFYVWNSGGTIIVNGGTYEASTIFRTDKDATSYPVDNYGESTITVTDGDFTGNVNITNEYGTVNVEGGTLTLTGASNNNGSFSIGSEVVLSLASDATIDGNGSITYGDEETVTGTVTSDTASGAYNSNVVFIDNIGDGSITLNEGATALFLCNVTSLTINFGDDTITDTVTLTNIRGAPLSIGHGSIIIAGTAQTIDGATDGEISINGDAYLTDDFYVEENVTLTIEDDYALYTNGHILYLESGSTASGIVYGTVRADNGANTDELTVRSDSMVEAELNGVYDSNATFGPRQIMVVTDSLVITNGATMTIEGWLVVEEDAEVIIEDGELILSNGSAIIEIEGSLVIEEEGTLTMSDGTVNVYGTMDIYGNANVGDAELIVQTDGTAIIREDGTMTGSDVTVYGTLEDYGILGISGTTNVDNYGTVIFDSTEILTNEILVNMLQNGATVEIRSFATNATETSGGLRIQDNTFHELDYEFEGESNAIRLTNANGTFTGTLVITESITGRGTETSPYVTTMDVSGSLSYEADEGVTNDSATFRPFGLTGVNVSGDLTIGSGIGFVNYAGSAGSGVLNVSGSLTVSAEATMDNQGMMNVTGTVIATADTEDMLTNSGTVTVSEDGIVTIRTNKTSIFEAGVVNATKYPATVNGVSLTNYVTIGSALNTAVEDDSVTNLTMLGENLLTESATLPAGATLTTGGSTSVRLTIGEANGSDVVLTIQENSVFRGNVEVYVNGTLYAEDKTDINNTVKSTIYADVYSEELDADGDAVRDGWAKWTNIFTAMDEAEAGDVVYVDREEGYVEITENLVIPDDVTLVVEYGKASLLLYNGVTLTVNGTLTTEVEVWAENEFDVAAYNVTTGNIRLSSAIVVNGTLNYDYENGLTYLYTEGSDNRITENDDGTIDYGTLMALSSGSPIAGAYYATGDYETVISTMDIAMASVEDILGSITVNGPVTAGDIVFEATDDCDTIEVGGTTLTNTAGTSTSLTVSSLTMIGSEDVTATLTANGAFTGTVVGAEASVDIDRVTGISVAVGTGMTVSNVGTMAGTATASSIVFSEGAATATGTYGVRTTVAEGVTVTSNGVIFDANLTVNGTVDIYRTSGFTSSRTVTIAEGGVFTVAANQTVSFNEVYVYGTLSVAGATDTTTSGSATANKIGIGISEDDVYEDFVDGSTGTVEGTVTSATANESVDSFKAYVSPDATVSDAMVEYLSGYAYTTFMVEDEEWFTVYQEDETTVDLPDDAPIENAVLTNWYDEDGNTVTDTGSTPYQAQDGILYANINYDIYTIYVLANEGVDDVFIDGQLMQYGMIRSDNDDYYYGYYAVVAAGTHTISYTVANGYSGDGVLYVNGTQQSGMTFTTSGDPATYNLQISGLEKSGYGETVITGDSDDGMTITDYLLIVLVILIVIMAVIVALRLRRS